MLHCGFIHTTLVTHPCQVANRLCIYYYDVRLTQRPKHDLLLQFELYIIKYSINECFLLLFIKIMHIYCIRFLMFNTFYVQEFLHAFLRLSQ